MGGKPSEEPASVLVRLTAEEYGGSICGLQSTQMHSTAPLNTGCASGCQREAHIQSSPQEKVE